MNPFFSIIIPAYNTGHRIEKCINTVFIQSFSDYEVIIVNDGSIDNTNEVIQEIILSHPEKRIVYLQQENQGAGASRNNAMDKANGQYLVFLDSDDYWDFDYLESIYITISEDKADVVFVDIVRETESGEVIRYEKMSKFSDMSKDRMIRSQLTGKMPWGGVRKIVKTSIIRDNKLCYAPIKVGEESIFSFGILENAEIISFQTKSFYHYVDDVGSLTHVDSIDNSLLVHDYIYDYFERSGKKAKYITTLRALSVTTIAIAINVINHSANIKNKREESIKIYHRFRDKIRGKIDIWSLDSRVLLLLPFIKCGFISPVLWASRLQSILKS